MTVDQDLSEQFRAMGADIAPMATTSPQDEAFDVLPANWISVKVWLRCETQWRVLSTAAGHLVRLGLDYSAVDVVLRRLGIEDPDATFADLQVMEDAALAVIRSASA